MPYGAAMPFKDMEVGHLRAIFVECAPGEGDVCVWGGGIPYLRGRPAWVQGWAPSGRGLCQKGCLVRIIMTALAPLECRHRVTLA